ncbi:peptidoglycan recognition family protein [Phycisphaerales bacterium AB-hyl4]|uniref:Peptidoglycan recognition family protein n=1 Tax=Natronomicrosphaera hydrolytica TaxID=3242702 RepID=A0ABV4UA37_9BACT
MSLSRRQMLLASMGLFVAGCAPTQTSVSRRPGTEWPGSVDRPRQQRSTRVDPRPRDTPTAPTPRQVPAHADGLNAVARSRWASAGPVTSRVNPMNGVSRITVHHEGWTSFWDNGEASTAERIERIRNVHVRDRGWGDIGYHYIIDRSGRIWQGRAIGYQGAHVGGANENNLGIMLLGNFDQQSPTDVQLDRLVSSLRSLMRTHNVANHRVYTHQELSPSACPGRNLQPRMVSLRRGGYLT